MEEIERRIDIWTSFYPERSVNTLDKRTGEKYTTKGILYPVGLYRAISDKVVPVYSGDEPTLSNPGIPLKVGSGVLR
jgi:hypothetical protein